MLGLIACVDGHGPKGNKFRGALQGGNIWWVAPTYGIASKIWRMLKDATVGAWESKSEVERRIVFPDTGYGNGSITVQSGDNPDALRGDGLDGVVMDEAAFMSEEVWTNALRPALADRSGWCIMISSPNQLNWFYEEYRKASESSRWQRPTSDNPIIVEAELEDAKAKMPYLSYRQEFLAEFVTDGAGVFMRDWFQYYDNDTVEFDRLIQSWDTAFKDKKDSDRSACLTVGSNKNGVYIVDCYAGRLQFPDLKQMAMDLYERYRPTAIVVEDKASGQSLIQELQRVSTPEGMPLPVNPFKVDRNKRARANAVSPLVRAGKVFLPKGAPWLNDFLHEIITFTGIEEKNSRQHDDIVDAFSMALSYLYWQPERPVVGGVKMSSLALGRDVPKDEDRHIVARDMDEYSEYGDFADTGDDSFLL